MRQLLQSHFDIGTIVQGRIIGYEVIPSQYDSHEQWMCLRDVRVSNVDANLTGKEICGVKTTTILQDFFTENNTTGIGAVGRTITLRKEPVHVTGHNGIPYTVETWQPIQLE
jgi:hypothetical protein